MLSRAIFPTPVLKRAYETRPRLSAHGGSAPLSRLAPSIPSLPPTAKTATKHPLLSSPLPPKHPPTQRALFSLRPSSSSNPIQQRVTEASHRYNDLDDRQLLLLYLDRQDEAWRKLSSSVRIRSWADYAVWVLTTGALLYGYYFVWPQLVAAIEEAKREKARNWNTVATNQRRVYDKLVEVEERLEKERLERGGG